MTRKEEILKAARDYISGVTMASPSNSKEENGEMLSTPNLRTKVGRAMNKFLGSFKRTNVWDVDRLWAIDEKPIYGSFYIAKLFEFNDRIYIIIDSQLRDVFEKNNTDIIEITNGEMTKAIDDYRHYKTTQQKN